MPGQAENEPQNDSESGSELVATQDLTQGRRDNLTKKFVLKYIMLSFIYLCFYVGVNYLILLVIVISITTTTQPRSARRLP